MIRLKDKRAAMEMSVGTIVTIVLLMSVLVLGIFLVTKVFESGNSAVGAIDDEVQNQIKELFQEDGAPVIILPSSGRIKLKKGTSGNFALGLTNEDSIQHTFTYTVEAREDYDYEGKCMAGMTPAKANKFLAFPGGEIEIRAKTTIAPKEGINFQIPKTAPSCSFPYMVKISNEEGPLDQRTIWVEVK